MPMVMHPGDIYVTEVLPGDGTAVKSTSSRGRTRDRI
jgi:hypothetical protein